MSIATSTSSPDQFILPDLIGHCHFPLAYHPDGDTIVRSSAQWLDHGCPELTPKKRAALYALKAGELSAYCYPHCNDERLRVVSDFMHYLFHLDDISDGLMWKGTEKLSDVVMNAVWFPDMYMPTTCPDKVQPFEEVSAGKLARDFWQRCIKDAKPGPQARFKESLQLFFEAVNQQARDREAGVIPDLESYIDMRRDTSGCKPVFDLIEYAMGIDLPEFVVTHPIIKALNQCTNDLITWSNDIFSYNVEQARGDTHNMIVILMKYHGLGLQDAIDYVGDLCKSIIDSFVEHMRNVPSWGPQIDKDVAVYVRGLQEWIIGTLHWSFLTERYFGKEAAEVKKHHIVRLLRARRGAPCLDYPSECKENKTGATKAFLFGAQKGSVAQ
ncbi:Alpha-muurolene synthase [Grifola frondosa]|uniref:Terpene synthase n=1 Tax=Grifola frondosa TaxID=5627 RepID=A0A1C7LYU3_GRIFR|nr:Alpha-muurolene synthase [Grifola frondosa]